MTDKKEALIKTVLPSGVTIEGTAESVGKLLTSLAVKTDVPAGYYMSATKGLVKISDMQIDHLRNAVFLRYSKWIDSLRDITDLNLLIVALGEGPEEDRVLIDMMSELVSRAKAAGTAVVKRSKK